MSAENIVHQMKTALPPAEVGKINWDNVLAQLKTLGPVVMQFVAMVLNFIPHAKQANEMKAIDWSAILAKATALLAAVPDVLAVVKKIIDIINPPSP